MAMPKMRYEIIEEAFDDAGRFVGVVEASTEDDTWSSGPSRVILGGDTPTDAEIRTQLKQWAKDHAPQAKQAADERAAKEAGPPARRFAPGVYDAASGDKVAEPTERDPETKKRKVSIAELIPGVADLPVK